MEPFDSLIIFAASMASLVVTSEATVMSAESLSHRLRLPQVVVGMFFLAIGTSLPELAITAFAALEGEAKIVLAMLPGANVSDATLVLGVAGLFGAITIRKKDAWPLVAASLMSAAVSAAALISGRLDAAFGVFAILMFAASTYFLVRENHGRRARAHGNVMHHAAVVVASIGGVLLSSHFVVASTIGISGLFGIPEALIAGLVIAFGTTLPEMAVSSIAMAEKRFSLALGNVAGSLITNLGLILGVASLSASFPLAAEDVMFFSASLIAGLLTAAISLRRRLHPHESLGLLFVYIMFFVLMLAK
ncbi:MAG: hypothetical protein QW548_03130 [Candidatus Aenigmatarchaeota archaeon]